MSERYADFDKPAFLMPKGTAERENFLLSDESRKTINRLADEDDCKSAVNLFVDTYRARAGFATVNDPLSEKWRNGDGSVMGELIQVSRNNLKIEHQKLLSEVVQNDTPSGTNIKAVNRGVLGHVITGACQSTFPPLLEVD